MECNYFITASRDYTRLLYGGERAAVFLVPRAARDFLTLEAVAVLGGLSLAGNSKVGDGNRVRGRFFGCSRPAHALIMHNLPQGLYTNSGEFVCKSNQSKLRTSLDLKADEGGALSSLLDRVLRH